MKVMHVLNSRIYSGAEKVVCQIIKSFRSVEGMEMVYCSPASEIVDKMLKEQDVTYLQVESLTPANLKRVIDAEKPDLILSTGAAAAVPFFYLGKLFGAKTMYIEVFDRIDKPTLTGKLVYPVTDRVVVQWEEMKQVYPKAVNLGSIF